jgi:hypothetical protein
MWTGVASAQSKDRWGGTIGEPWQWERHAVRHENEPGLLSWLVFAHLSLIFPTDTPLPHTDVANHVKKKTRTDHDPITTRAAHCGSGEPQHQGTQPNDDE